MDLNVNDLSFTLMKRTFNIFEKKPVMARDTRFIPKSLYNLWKSDCAVSSWGPCTCLRTRSRTWNFVNLLARIYYSGWLAGWLVVGTANQVNKDHIKLNLNMSRASNAILPNAKHYPCPRRAEIWSILLIYISCARMIYFIIQFNYATSLARCACALFFFFFFTLDVRTSLRAPRLISLRPWS